MINRKYLDELQEVLEAYSFQLSFEELVNYRSTKAKRLLEWLCVPSFIPAQEP